MKASRYLKLGLCSSLLAITAVTAVAGVKGETGNNDGLMFTANLTTATVTHKLYQPGDKNVPQPFYKKTCAKQQSQAYKGAHGQATIWFNPKKNELWFAFAYQGLSGSPIMMHFHLGKAGVGGPIVQTICGMPPPSSPQLGYSKGRLVGAQCPKGTSGFLVGHYKLKGNPHLTPAMNAEQEKQALMNGQLYINIHTCLNELGELRGQVVPVS